MKKYFFLTVLFAFFSISAWSQTDSTKTDTAKATASPGKTAQLLSKADSLMVELANKQHIDTNASVEDLGKQFDQDEKLIPTGSPTKHPMMWLKFLSALVILAGGIYFKVKHVALKAKALAQGLKLGMLLFLFFGFSTAGHSQTLSTKRVETYLKTHPVAAVKLQAKPNKLGVAVVAPLIPATGHIVYLAPNIGIGGLVIQKSISGWEAAGQIDPSISYSLGIGEYTTNADGSLDIQPYTNFAVFMAGGLIPQNILKKRPLKLSMTAKQNIPQWMV
ncbi:MAG: hypothetical protein ACHP6H_02860 [Legionellales bacterium]